MKTSNSSSAKTKAMTVESTPTSKRTATKRKLIDEEKTDDADTTKGEDHRDSWIVERWWHKIKQTISYLYPNSVEEPSKDDEIQINKEIELPKEVKEKETSAAESPTNQSDRTVRRSRN